MTKVFRKYKSVYVDEELNSIVISEMYYFGPQLLKGRGCISHICLHCRLGGAFCLLRLWRLCRGGWHLFLYVVDTSSGCYRITFWLNVSPIMLSHAVSCFFSSFSKDFSTMEYSRESLLSIYFCICDKFDVRCSRLWSSSPQNLQSLIWFRLILAIWFPRWLYLVRKYVKTLGLFPLSCLLKFPTYSL